MKNLHFFVPSEFSIMGCNNNSVLLQKASEESQMASADICLIWDKRNIIFKVRIAMYGIDHYDPTRDNKPEDETMYCQKDYYYTKDNRHAFIPTVHLIKNGSEMPRFGEVIDSSIWNYYCELNDQDYLKNLLEIIANNTKNELYSLAVSYEFADFNARLLSQNYVAECGGHVIVSPFLYHSETEMRKLLVNWNSLKQNWRFLLVDDHAVRGMGYVEDKSPRGKRERTPFGKAHIIANDFLNAGLSVNINCYDLDTEFPGPLFYQRAIHYEAGQGNTITIDCATNIKRAYELVTKSRYDIILLDYKLDRNKDSNQIEFGYELLQKVHDSHHELHEDGCIGPDGRYYFMFISAYTTAVSQRILKEGFRISTKYWFVDKGACPTNTPYLFLYSLKRLMDKRYESLIKHGKDLAEILKLEKVDKPIITAIDFIAALYSSQEVKTVRSRCKNAFNAFLTLRSTYDKIKYDVFDEKRHLDQKGKLNCRFVDKEEKESKLIRCMFPDVVCYSNIFWEHMQHLVYLTAYGTNRQWPEMWEELMSVSDILKEAEKTGPTNTGTSTVKLIRNYILILKAEHSR